MLKHLVYYLVLLPLSCLAQLNVSGRVLSEADNKPVANASVFINNATIGDKTAADGTFTLHNVNAGKYELIISIVGYNTFLQNFITADKDIHLPDIKISPKTIGLQEVVIKPDVKRPQYYEWFKEQFLGTSDLAQECKILNPEILSFDYNEATNTLTASTNGFLEIENNALGYYIKYQLINFSLVNKDSPEVKVYYKGPASYADMKGTVAQERRWINRRSEVYENSEMHFLRSATNNSLEAEGFSVQQLAIYANPERPPDSVINSRISYYKKFKKIREDYRDSLSYWDKKAKLPKTLQTLIHSPLNGRDFIQPSDQPNVNALGCDFDALYVSYSKSHHFFGNGQLAYVNTVRNTENTLITFKSPYAFFYNNGVLANPYSVVFYGVWGRNRVAEQLPIDYNAPDEIKNTADSAVAKNIIAKLKTFAASYNPEKVYLQFDKPYYAAGDTIYFKAYITNGDSNKLSDISGVIHVDLFNSKNKIDQSIKLQVTQGVAWGDFVLPDSLPENIYRVRAYTKWMLNERDSSYFSQDIPVGSIRAVKIPEALTRQPDFKNKPDVQCFPEGGSLVNGINSKIAFKAIGSNGLGIDVKGELLDNEHKQMATFESSHLGMGCFFLTPENGKTYSVKFTYPDGSQDTVSLPTAAAEGITLSVDNQSISHIALTVIASEAYYKENKNKKFTLIAYRGGIPEATIFKLDNPSVTLSINKNNLLTGIVTLSLFSPGGEPLCERLFFVQNFDQLSIQVNSNKPGYTAREKVNLTFKIKNSREEPAMGHFSVSVVSENTVPYDENKESSILANLLLTADLKGYIEQPNYYFANVSDKTTAGLDLVMLTHGYRRFQLEKILNNKYPAITAMPEKGLEISGVVNSLQGTPLRNGTVSLLSMNGGPLHSQEISADGTFSFSNLTFRDSSHFFLRAANEKLKHKTAIVYNGEKPVAVNITNYPEPGQQELNNLLAAYLENSRLQQQEATKYGSVNGILLKEVNINDNKNYNYPSSNLAGPGFADQVIHRSEFQGSGLFSDYFNGRLIGVTFQGPEGPGDIKRAYLITPITLGQNPPMLVVVDGVKFTPDDGFSVDDEVNVQDIETVEVLRNQSAGIYGALGGAGVLVITTRKSTDGQQSKLSPGMLSIMPNGFYRARAFYSPKYDHQEDNLSRKDLRSTIYWKPELITDINGNASVDFYNADLTGSYRVIIEGIGADGNIGRQVYRYLVK